MQCRPDEIFDKCLHTSIILPDGVLSWPIQMCSEYFTALAKELLDIIITRGFKMPLVVNLNTKSKQLAAFQ